MPELQPNKLTTKTSAWPSKSAQRGKTMHCLPLHPVPASPTVYSTGFKIRLVCTVDSQHSEMVPFGTGKLYMDPINMASSELVVI